MPAPQRARRPRYQGRLHRISRVSVSPGQSSLVAGRFCDPLNVEMAKLLEFAEARGDFLVGQAQAAAQAEILHRKAGDNGAKNRGAAEVRLGEVARACEIAHEAAGETVACTGGVADILHRVSRSSKDGVIGVQADAVLTALDGD